MVKPRPSLRFRDVPPNAVQRLDSGRGLKELLWEKLGPPATLVFFAVSTNCKEALTCVYRIVRNCLWLCESCFRPSFFAVGGPRRPEMDTATCYLGGGANGLE